MVSRDLTTTLTADDLDRYHRDGYHVARGLLSAGEAETIRDTFTAQAKDGPVEGLSDGGAAAFSPGDPLSFYPRMMHPHRHDEKPVGPLAMRYMLDRRIGDVLRGLLADEPLAAQSMFYFKPPGARGQDLHQDNFYLRVAPGTCMAAWIAVDPADRGNGGMVVVPGSHRFDVECPSFRDDILGRSFTNVRVDPPEGYEERGIDLAAGDVLFFNGSVIHGSYPNTSQDRFRRSLIFHYLPASAEAISKHYHPLYNFAGEVVSRAEATGGGPCGEVAEPSRPH